VTDESIRNISGIIIIIIIIIITEENLK